MDAVMADPAAQKIIVTHGGSATFVIAHWFGMPLVALDVVSFRLASGSITHLREDDYFHNHAVVSLTLHLDIDIDSCCKQLVEMQQRLAALFPRETLTKLATEGRSVKLVTPRRTCTGGPPRGLWPARRVPRRSKSGLSRVACSG